MSRRLSAALAAVAVLCLSPIASAGPFTVDDLLHEQSFGAVTVDPTGRWVVIERRDPYDSLGRYDHYLQMGAALSRLLVADLAHPGPARPLLTPDAGPGIVIGGFSPSGAYLAVYRLRDRRRTLGVVALATGTVRWFPITPERSEYGRSLQWRSDDELLVIDRPDGSAPWTFQEGRASAETLPTLWAASAHGRAARTVLGSGAYVGYRAPPSPRRLLHLNARNGEIRTFAEGAFTDLELSPDGRRVALFEIGPDIQPRKDGPVQGAMGVQTQVTRLSILDLATGSRITPCPGRDALPHLLAWSPSGRGLLAYVRAVGAAWRDGTLVRIDAATAAAEPARLGLQPELTYRPEIIRAGWMGETPIVLARRPGAPRADWYRIDRHGAHDLTARLPEVPRTLEAVGAKGLVALADGAAWRVTSDGRAAKVAAGARSLRPSLHRPPGRVEAVASADGWIEARGRLVRASPGGLHAVLVLNEAPGNLVAASTARRSAIFHQRNAGGRETLDLVGADGVRTRLAEVNVELSDTTAPIVRRVHHQGPAGEMLTSWLFLPPEPSDAPPPLVVQPYAGAIWPNMPIDRPGEAGFPISLRMLVGHGYAVLVPSLPTPRQGDPMADLGPRLLAIVDAADQDPTFTHAFDPARLAVWGYSFGGYTVMAAIGQTSRFRAAVSIAGPSELVSKWASLPAAHRTVPEEGIMSNWSTGSIESGQSGMGAPPWRDPGRYLRNSPLLAADRIETPLMLIHGDQDPIPLGQSEAMFSALYRQGKDAILVTYWGEGHVITSPGNVRDLYARAFAFLDAHLAAHRGGAPGRPSETGALTAGWSR